MHMCITYEKRNKLPTNCAHVNRFVTYSILGLIHISTAPITITIFIT